MRVNLCAAFAMVISFSTTAFAETLVFSPVPQQSAAATAARWQPLVQALEETTGLDIDLRIAPDIPTFEACLAAGRFDLAYMNPYHFAVFSDAVGYRAIAHRVGPGLRGILVASADSAVSDPAAVAGQQVAFPSATAFGASVLVQAELRARGIAFDPVYVRSHDSVYLAVNARAMTAGGGVERTLRLAPDHVRDNLRIVFQTQAYTPHAFAAHPRVRALSIRILQRALLDMAAARSDVLKPLGLPGWQVPAADAYDDVRGLDTAPAQVGMDDLEARTCRFG